MRVIFYLLGPSKLQPRGPVLLDTELPCIPQHPMVIVIDGTEYICSTSPRFIFESDDRNNDLKLKCMEMALSPVEA